MNSWNLKTMVQVSLLILALTATVMGGAFAQGGAPNAPFAGGKPVTLAEAVKLAPQQDKDLVPLSKAYDAADAKLKKAPKDAAAKKAYVEAAYKFGFAAETSNALGPKVKYRAALALFRKALAVDPKHGPSLAKKTEIEEIYKGMPGGVPQK